VDKIVLLLQHSIEHVSIVYTCNTYFVIYSRVSGQYAYTIAKQNNTYKGVKNMLTKVDVWV